MKMKEIMTDQVKVIPPDCSITEAAQRMRELDVGAVPVCDGDRLCGMLTDRDITIKVVAEAKDIHQVTAQEVMTSPIVYCFEDDDVEDAARIMESRQVRRLVVLNRQKRLVGIVALGDLAAKTGNEPLAGETLEKISEPARPDRVKKVS